MKAAWKVTRALQKLLDNAVNEGAVDFVGRERAMLQDWAKSSQPTMQAILKAIDRPTI